MQSLVKAVRNKVSADKFRLTNGKYDLDLTYICDRIVAMSFPADGVESAYRNSIHEVSEFLLSHHKNHFEIYNLSERKYDYKLFSNRVFDWCGFPDHHAPPLAMLFKIVLTMGSWLSCNPQNIAVIHCLAGKGRTGTVIAAFLLYASLFETAADATHYFSLKRSFTSWGVTGASQKRYIQYFADILHNKFTPREAPAALVAIRMHGYTRVVVGAMRETFRPVIKVFSISPNGGTPHFICGAIENDTVQIVGDVTTFRLDRVVHGDLLITCSHSSSYYLSETMFRCNIHVGMVETTCLRLMKNDLDGADGDGRFPNDFYIELVFSELQGEALQAACKVWEADMGTEAQLFILPRLKQAVPGEICFFANHINMADRIEAARYSAFQSGVTAGKSGYLTKKGHHVKNWKRRWFVLKDSTLTYYKSPKDLTPAGVITLGKRCLLEDPSPFQTENMPHCFELVSHGRSSSKFVSYIISAPSAVEKKDWMRAIKSATEVGRLFVECIEAKWTNLGADVEHHVNCVLSFGLQSFHTDTIKSNTNPVWHQAVEFVVREERCDLSVLIMQRDDSNSSLFAEAVISMDELERQVDSNGCLLDYWLPLSLSPLAHSFAISEMSVYLSIKLQNADNLNSIDPLSVDTFDTDVDIYGSPDNVQYRTKRASSQPAPIFPTRTRVTNLTGRTKLGGSADKIPINRTGSLPSMATDEPKRFGLNAKSKPGFESKLKEAIFESMESSPGLIAEPSETVTTTTNLKSDTEKPEFGLWPSPTSMRDPATRVLERKEANYPNFLRTDHRREAMLLGEPPKIEEAEPPKDFINPTDQGLENSQKANSDTDEGFVCL